MHAVISPAEGRDGGWALRGFTCLFNRLHFKRDTIRDSHPEEEEKSNHLISLTLKSLYRNLLNAQSFTESSGNLWAPPSSRGEEIFIETVMWKEISAEKNCSSWMFSNCNPRGTLKLNIVVKTMWAQKVTLCRSAEERKKNRNFTASGGRHEIAREIVVKLREQKKSLFENIDTRALQGHDNCLCLFGVFK